MSDVPGSRHKLPGRGDPNYEHIDVVQMNKPVVRPREFLRITGPPRAFQIDQINFEDMPKQNKGYTKALVLIDILSRKAFVYMMKTFQMRETIERYKEFLATVGHVESVCGDDAFNNKDFAKLNKERRILVMTGIAKHDHGSYGNRLGILDRFVRTLKNRVRVHMQLNGPKYHDAMTGIVDDYNKTLHSSLFKKRQTPNNVFESPEMLTKIRADNANHNKRIKSKMKFYPPGTEVRILEEKKTFGKETARFSAQVHTVNGMTYNKYQINSSTGKTIMPRLYKEWELLKVDREKIIPYSHGAAAVQKEQSRKRVMRRLVQKEGLDINDIHLEIGQQPAMVTRRAALQTHETSATKALDSIVQGSVLSVVFRLKKKLQWFNATVQKVWPTKGHDKDGQILYVDIVLDDGQKVKLFKLYEPYYMRGNVESGWKLVT